MLSRNEILLLLLYHLCIRLIPFKSISSVFNHLSSFSLLSYQVPNLGKIISKCLLLILSVLILHMSLYSLFSDHVFHLISLVILISKFFYQLFLLSVELLIQLKVLLLLNFQYVLHDF